VRKLGKLIITIESDVKMILDATEQKFKDEWKKMPKDQTIVKVNIQRE
jgi:hypothetical protein